MANKSNEKDKKTATAKENQEKVKKESVENAESDTEKKSEEIGLDVAQRFMLEMEEQKSLYLRLRADFENYKRNKEQEVLRAKSLGMVKALETILPALDSFDRALLVEMDDKQKEGILLIKKQLDDALEKLGVTEIKALGEVFDPKYHYAVMSVEDSENEGKVIEVLQKGYILGKEVIRYSMVKVAN